MEEIKDAVVTVRKIVTEGNTCAIICTSDIDNAYPATLNGVSAAL